MDDALDAHRTVTYVDGNILEDRFYRVIEGAVADAMRYRAAVEASPSSDDASVGPPRP